MMVICDLVLKENTNHIFLYLSPSRVRNFYVHLIVQFDKKLQQNYHTTVSYGTNNMTTTNKQTHKNNKKWQKRFPDKLVIPHIITTFFEFYGTRRFITVFTRACHWSLSWNRWSKSATSHAFYLRLILILISNLRLRIITATTTTATIPTTTTTTTTDITTAATIIINNNNNNNNNNNLGPFQSHLENTWATYQEITKLRNYRKQPYWALHTHFGKC